MRIVLLVLSVVALAGCITSSPLVQPPSPPDPSEASTHLRTFPDGAPLSQERKELTSLASVVIDNMQEAHPPSGVSRAPLVIEAPVEGGITRLLAFYPLDTTISKIGPVRSLRPYFLSLSEDFASLIAHVGGSPEALVQEKTTHLVALNEFFHTLSFWRDSNRPAPHNLYTSTSRLSEALLSQKRANHQNKLTKNPWQYSEQLPSELTPRPQPAATLTISASSPAYAIAWEYDNTTLRYSRMQGGRLHKYQDGVVLSAHNVIVLQTKITIEDEVGRRAITLDGQGKAWVLRDGVVLKGLWQRSAQQPLNFISDEGAPLPLHPGVTWIEIIPSSTLPDIAS